MFKCRECPPPAQGQGTVNHGLWVSLLPFLVQWALICLLLWPRHCATCPGRGPCGRGSGRGLLCVLRPGSASQWIRAMLVAFHNPRES